MRRTRFVETKRKDIDRSNWQEFLPDGKTPRCQAVKKRSTEQCGLPADPGKRVCRFHGGRSTGPPLKSGFYSSKLPRDLAARYEVALKDPEIISVRHEIAITQALIEQHLPRLQDGLPPLSLLTRAHDNLQTAIRIAHTDAPRALALMRTALADFDTALSAHKAHAEAVAALLALIEARRKLVQTEAQVIKDKHAVITAEQAMALVTAIVSVVTRHVSDKKAIQRIADEVGQLTGYSRN